MPCSGLDACKVAFLKAAKGVWTATLLRAWPVRAAAFRAGIIIRSPKNQMEVDKHAKEAAGRTIQTVLEESEK